MSAAGAGAPRKSIPHIGKIRLAHFDGAVGIVIVGREVTLLAENMEAAGIASASCPS